MNAFTMKLESRQLLISNQEQSKNIIGQKKCKNLKKKANSSSCDKDALLKEYGLGRKFNDKIDLNNPNLETSIKNNCSKRVRSKKDCSKVDKMFTESDKIQERLQKFLSNEDKEKIMCILNDIRSLSDIEKLYLYLQLPTGSPLEVDPFKQKIQNPLGKKADEEGMFAVTWIQSHLEEDPDISLPKQEVYDEYQLYCTMSGSEPLCAADFGKVMKQIFPSVKPRRLGTRGNSRYCYSGLRKKLNVAPPFIPDIQKDKEKSLSEECASDEVTSAACHLMFEWAEKLLGVRFTSLKDLATHLLEHMYVDNRSVAAFTLLLDASPHLLIKGFAPEGGAGGIKRSEAQFHLQRKIQEKELIKEQKRKLQEQRNNLANISSLNRSPKKKFPKCRKAKSNGIENVELKCDKAIEPTCQRDQEDKELPIKKSEIVRDSFVHADVISPEEDKNFQTDKNFTESHLALSPSVLEISHSSLVQSPTSSETEDSSKLKNKILMPQNKTPVCIAQSLPGILIVPSLPQLTQDIGKPNLNTPKYKRIQPKPLQSEAFNVISRSRAGSVGSSLPNKPKTHNVDGRRSSHAWLQSDTDEEKLLKNISVNAGVSFKTIQEKNINRNVNTLKDNILFETPHNSIATDSPSKTISSTSSNHIHEKRRKIPELQLKSSYIQANSSSEMEDSNSIKRQLDENDHADNKRVHLDSYKTSHESSPWIPKSSDVSTISNTQLSSNKQFARIGQEEVNVHEIEGDAFNDYFRNGNSNTTHSLQPASLTNKVQQLSQLRMLLEQNLPSAISKTSTNSVKIHKVSKCIDTSEIIQSDLSINLKKSFIPVLQTNCKSVNSNIFIKNEANSPNAVNNISLKTDPEVDSLERLLSSSYLASDAENEQLTDPNVFLNGTQNVQDMDIGLENELDKNSGTSDMLLSTNFLSGADMVMKQSSPSLLNGRVSTCTQVPSVPQSPNTRRRAFNFMPISPRHTPIPEGMGTTAISSQMRTMVSTGVGPSQPPSNSGSPFVSPRSTPVPLCRSRHSSGQSTYSTSRHTPFQNFDSGVSSVSSSPFISPQPTPVPVSRLRHNSTHGSNKTVTFCSINSPQVIHAGNNVPRTRHSSGPGAPNIASFSPSSSLSPLVSESASSFVFPPGANEIRSHPSSISNTNITPFSPVSEQASSSNSCTSNIPDVINVSETSVSTSQSFLNDGAGDLLISANPTSFRQVRHRHASSSVIYGKSSFTPRDIFSQEIQKLLKNYQENGTTDLLNNRSQSVPLHQMLQTTDGYCFLSQPAEDFSAKSQPSTPVLNQMFTFGPNQDPLGTDISCKDKLIVPTSQMEWSSFDGAVEFEPNPVRRNLTSLYDAPPLSDDLQTTLEDLRDCDTDFSKLELELRQNEESGL